VLAFRALGIVNRGERVVFYGMGGLNNLRGYDFRAFYGSNVASANLELRFPFVDELRFPIGPLRNIRGFLFLDAGTAWLPGDQFFDPDSQLVRAQPNFDGTFRNIPFDWWDSKNDRLQDLRGSYGTGFQFFFLGGLQFNWVWSKRLSYTSYVDDPSTPLVYDLIPVKADSGAVRSEFYITFDW
jgi:outer membrane protein assembly factor BamA